MSKIIKQEDLDPNGFVCTGGKITPVVPTAAFNCSQLNTCPLDSLSNITMAGASAGDFLVYDGTTVVTTQLTTGIQTTVVQPSHGFTLPSYGFLPLYLDSATDLWVEANTTTLPEAHIAFAVSIPSGNSFILQQQGVLNVSGGHGLVIGDTYYLQDDGSIDIVAAANVTDKVATPIDVENILLTDDDAFVPASTTSGLHYTQDFITTTWMGTGPYTLTILPATHNLGSTKYLRATVYESGTPNTEVTVQVTVEDTGTVVLESNSLFDGYVILTNHQYTPPVY